MPNVWNIGNTTVRNPKRIETALKVFLIDGFSGNIDTHADQARLHAKLKERGELEFQGEPSDWNGRKWRSAFYQLGFISNNSYRIDNESISVEELFNIINHPEVDKKYELTIAGNKLLEAESIAEIEDIYTRQFACYELPDGLEKSFPDGNMKPFILFLQVSKRLDELEENGLNKLETELFLQKFRDHNEELHTNIVDEVIQFRNDLDELESEERRETINQYLEDFYTDIDMSLDSRSVRDYADTTFRYFSLSGLFTRIEDTLVIRPNKKEFVDKLLETEPLFNYNEDPVIYFDHFYKNNYPIPTDEKEFALKEIRYLKNEIRNEENLLLEQADNISEDDDLSDIQELRFKLIEYNKWEREEDFANEQQEPEAVKEILKYLRKLNDEAVEDSPDIDDRPAFLEWAVWRSFLAIDKIISPIHETRRFPIDYDFLPRNTAPGGGADLVFEFKNYVLAVEVTLTTSHRQMAVESEPVRRHTVGYKEQYPDKDVYCLFIAPDVDNNVAETFRIGVWYKEDQQEFVNIVPFSLSDFISTIEILLDQTYTNSDFRNLLDRCLVFRNVHAPEWKSSITEEVQIWKNRIIEF